MSENAEDDARRERITHDRDTLKLALSTMSVRQLRKLRSTIVRLKHLPFTKLTEVLFTEMQDADDQRGSVRIREDHPASAYNSCGHRESKATRELLEDVESTLQSKEEVGED